MTTLLITGETYQLRRQIKACGGKWDGENKGWIAPLEKKEQISALSEKIEISEIESPEDCFKPMTLEEKRAHIQGIRNRRAERLLKMAENREQKADGLRKEVEPFISDIAFVTQPITQNAGGRSFARFRERINGKVDRRFGLENEADELRERAKRLSAPVAIKGDAEKRRQEKRDLADSLLSVGSYVNTFIYGKATIIKINKKTYSVKCDNGAQGKVDKSFVELIK